MKNLTRRELSGMLQTTFTNQQGPALIWRTMFHGEHERLRVNGREAKATIQMDDNRERYLPFAPQSLREAL